MTRSASSRSAPGRSGCGRRLWRGRLPGARTASSSARLAARRTACLMELPTLLDMLTIAISAGLALEQALDQVARQGAGAVARELQHACREMALGRPLADRGARGDGRAQRRARAGPLRRPAAGGPRAGHPARRRRWRPRPRRCASASACGSSRRAARRACGWSCRSPCSSCRSCSWCCSVPAAVELMRLGG